MILLSALIAARVLQTPKQSVLDFMEQFIASEVVLQLDRRDVKAAKNNKAALQVLMNDAAKTRSLIQSYEDANLVVLASDSPKPMLDFRSNLEELKASLDASKLLPPPAKKGDKSKSDCCDHDAAYLKLIISALRTPGMSAQALNSATQYNLWPVLYEKNHGLIYADPSVTDKALILPRAIRKGSAFRKGDVITAVRGDDEEEWEIVHSWKDVLKASKDFETGEHEVFLQVRRNKTLKDITVVSSTVIVNTE